MMLGHHLIARRMWAGGRFEYSASNVLRVGDLAERRSVIDASRLSEARAATWCLSW